MILLLALTLRIPFADRCPWVDETFSICVANGHSLEGRAKKSNDYIDETVPIPASEYRKHLQPTLNFGDVLSAVARSDTSPPLHYLLLRGWFAVFGSSAVAGRFLSILFGLAAIFTLYLLGREINHGTEIFVALLACCSTIQLTTVTETRMYGLLMFCCCLSLLLTFLLVRGQKHAIRPWVFWFAVNLAGLLSHYLFVGMFLAVNLYLAIEWLRRRSISLRLWLLTATICGVLFLLWSPAIITQFTEPRTTSGWLATDMSIVDIVRMGLRTTGALVFGFHWNRIISAILLLAAVVGIVRAWRRHGESTGLLLLLGFSVPVAFVMGIDLIRSTSQVAVPRYLLPAAPAMYLALAYAAGGLPRWFRIVVVGGVCCLLIVGGFWKMMVKVPEWEPFDIVGVHITNHASPDDFILIRSIPSGVVTTCQFLDRDQLVGAMTHDMDERQAHTRVADLISTWKGDGSIWLVDGHTVWSQSFKEDTEWILDALNKSSRLVERHKFGQGNGTITLFRFSPINHAHHDQRIRTPSLIPSP